MTEAPGPVADRAATVQLLGIASLVLVPFCGIGGLVAVVALAMARTERRARAAVGAPPMPAIGVVCASISLAVVGLVVVAALIGVALLAAGSTGSG